MNIRNRFLIIMNRRLARYPKDKRQSMLSKILDDLGPTGILSSPIDSDPVEVSEAENNNWWDSIPSIRLSAEDLARLDSQQRIDLKRKELIAKKVLTDTIADDVDFSEKDVDREEDSHYGRTKLHEAVLAGDLDAISDMLSSGCDIAAKDNNGNSPIDLARLEENIEAIKILEQAENSTKKNDY